MSQWYPSLMCSIFHIVGIVCSFMHSRQSLTFISLIFLSPFREGGIILFPLLLYTESVELLLKVFSFLKSSSLELEGLE